MTPAELKPIVKAWGGVERLAREIGMSNRTVNYWLVGRHHIKPPIAMLIRSLKPPKRKE
jgi:DNA-binding transcriptional regulator YdaS (Cro superfamily)